MTYVITEQCIDVKEKGCIDDCPVDWIYEGQRMLYIHPRLHRASIGVCLLAWA